MIQKHIRVNDDWESCLEKSEHLCDDCEYSFDEESSEKFDNLSEFEVSESKDTKQSLTYIAGCVVRKDAAEEI